MEPVLARKMHRTLEPVHGIVYFAPEPADAYVAIGLAGRSGYFASRAAAMGPVPPEVVIATFFNFHPDLVHRALDGVWERVSPEAVLAARHAGIDATLRRILGDAVDSPEVLEAAELARTAADDLPQPGRPLFAAHAALPWPTAPHMVLWHAQTLIREFRGDAHIACLVEAGVASGCEALVQHAASGDVPAATLQSSRQWPDDEWGRAVAALVERGWLEPDGTATDAGRALREGIEARTDELSMAPWRQLGQEGSDRLRALVRPMSQAIVGSGELGFGPRGGGAPS
jgi:hypothetical protein